MALGLIRVLVLNSFYDTRSELFLTTAVQFSGLHTNARIFIWRFLVRTCRCQWCRGLAFRV